MKKLLLLVVAVVFGIGTMFADPVDVNTAKTLGQKFVQANFEQTRNANLELVYTVMSDGGEACVYVFNVGDNGFVMISATDNVRPVLAYSEESSFDGSNPYNGIMYMLDTYKNSISYAIEKNIVATPDVVGEWKSLENNGKLSNKRANKVGPLVETKWNQNNPYNLYSPACPQGGSDGRCYAGCVATAMSQVMKYWNHPIQGEGSHSYNCVGTTAPYYNYGTQSANFGATTYDWDNMPNTLSGATQTQIEAVALLMYHCGVSVDMMFDYDGSGSYSHLVPGAMAQYFDYDYCVQRSRSSYSLTNWNNMLKEEFDLGRPVYYSGQDPTPVTGGGHAFVCDGYDENDHMHFNFGWSGSGDGWFAVDAIDYATSAAAIFNYVPTEVYQNTLQAPTGVTVTKTDDLAQQATITWTNPTKTMNNQTVSSLDQIVVKRNGEVVYTVDNPTPGANMSFVDDDIPFYSTFEYRVYAVKNGVNGAHGADTESFGPTCQWVVTATSQSMQGWNSGYVMVYDGAGHEVAAVTMTNNTPTNFPIDITIGKVSFAWRVGGDAVNLSFKIKDSTGDVVYQYEGSSDDIPAGVFYYGNNGCGNAAPSAAPSNLQASTDDDNVILTWEGSAKTNYGFNVYRDGLLCALVHSNEFVDEDQTMGGHCYQVCVIGDGGESEMSNEECITVGEGCDPGVNLWYEIQPTNFKPIITWEHPANTDELSGYYVYRKVNENGEYERVKIVTPNKTEYKETKTLEDGNWYYYKVVAYYQDANCLSAPIKTRYGNGYSVKIYYSTDGVDENEVQNVEVYPNPTKDVLTVKAENISSVVVYNSIGQKVFAQTLDANETTVNMSNFEAGIYMVRIVANGNEITKRVSVIR